MPRLHINDDVHAWQVPAWSQANWLIGVAHFPLALQHPGHFDEPSQMQAPF